MARPIRTATIVDVAAAVPQGGLEITLPGNSHGTTADAAANRRLLSCQTILLLLQQAAATSVVESRPIGDSADGCLLPGDVKRHLRYCSPYSENGLHWDGHGVLENGSHLLHNWLTPC